MEKIINDALSFAQQILAFDSSGHDYQHVVRVYNIAMMLNSNEKVNEIQLGLTAILHDVDDHKIFNTSENKDNARSFLIANNIENSKIEVIIKDIKNISYSQGDSSLLSKIGQIVCDADRLDAIGAIGIARCFSYSGSTNRSLDDSIKHFDDKLFKLQALMFCDQAKKIAKERSDFMHLFYQQYQKELAESKTRDIGK